MKIIRSTKCTLKYTNKIKLEQLDLILKEYSKVVNHFINLFWDNCPSNSLSMVKSIVDSPLEITWLSARMRKVAALEAFSMVKANRNRDKEKAIMPKHKGNEMMVSCTIAELLPAKESKDFDCWLHLSSIGNKISLDLPIKRHKHFNDLASRGKRLNSYIITREYVQFCFERETGKKKESNACIGIDSGINALASTSEGKQFGLDIKKHIERIKRCKQGSKGQKRARQALKQRINEVAKEVLEDGVTLVVVENLKNITKETKLKRRLSKNIRRSIGNWNVRYWLTRLEMNCEEKNVSFRTVSPWYTSQTCSECGHTDRRNRKGEIFCCLKCGYKMNADVQASRNILTRFLTGKYGSGCKAKPVIKNN